jgi:hypothetical protein
MEVIATTKAELDDAKRFALQHLDHYMHNCFLGLPAEQIAEAWNAVQELAMRRKHEAQKVATRP